MLLEAYWNQEKEDQLVNWTEKGFCEPCDSDVDILIVAFNLDIHAMCLLSDGGFSVITTSWSVSSIKTSPTFFIHADISRYGGNSVYNWLWLYFAWGRQPTTRFPSPPTLCCIPSLVLSAENAVSPLHGHQHKPIMQGIVCKLSKDFL